MNEVSIFAKSSIQQDDSVWVEGEVEYSKTRQKELQAKKKKECVIINGLIRRTLENYGVKEIRIEKPSDEFKGIKLMFKIDKKHSLNSLSQNIQHSSTYGIKNVYLKTTVNI